jgi:hypothetical protein
MKFSVLVFAHNFQPVFRQNCGIPLPLSKLSEIVKIKSLTNRGILTTIILLKACTHESIIT